MRLLSPSCRATRDRDDDGSLARFALPEPPGYFITIHSRETVVEKHDIGPISRGYSPSQSQIKTAAKMRSSPRMFTSKARGPFGLRIVMRIYGQRPCSAFDYHLVSCRIAPFDSSPFRCRLGRSLALPGSGKAIWKVFHEARRLIDCATSVPARHDVCLVRLVGAETESRTPPRVIPMKLETLRDLLVEQLQDLYDAEKRITKALPKMAKAATSTELKAAFEKHLGETEGQVERLEKAFEAMGEKPKTKTCKAMQGLIAEGEETIKEDAEAEVKDAALIAAAQRVEHYEMAAYGTVSAYAKLLNEKTVLKLLQETLAEEKATDEALTELAESTINVGAV